MVFGNTLGKRSYNICKKIFVEVSILTEVNENLHDNYVEIPIDQNTRKKLTEVLKSRTVIHKVGDHIIDSGVKNDNGSI